MSGTFYGVGVGPGDPELMTLKAWRLIEQADVISFIANEEGESQAKTIALEAIASNKNAPLEIPVCVPMVNNRQPVNRVYDSAAKSIKQQLLAGKNVVFICEGDPLFFGSFAYLLERLEGEAMCQVVPGISSVHAASSALKRPLTMLKESFSVMSGRHTQKQLEAALNTHDTVVIMKAGRSRQRILDALVATNRTADANYLEYIGRDNQRLIKEITTLEAGAGPYFSLFVVIRQQRDRT
jgi:precorrin-2/cobalt-factor-2 C20-methyltransferase